ncbi:hypothetical protein, conserved [Eimeria praecox]|uniref:Uncharacterized protein n=1 Tax=Eimeria praecox TaxID=51316 RepID=U6H4W8_9EIME|nr:hypothetical protein, conserved [Eimeria praecox]
MAGDQRRKAARNSITAGAAAAGGKRKIKGKQHQQTELLMLLLHRSSNLILYSRHHGRSSSSRGKKKDKGKAASTDRTSNAAAASEQQPDSLFEDWPPIDFTFPESSAVAPAEATGHETLSWGRGGADDPFLLSAADSCGAAAAAAEDSVKRSRGGGKSRSRRREKNSSSRPREPEAPSSDGDSSSSSSNSNSSGLSSSTRSREDSSDSETTKGNSKRHRRHRRNNRSRLQPSNNGEAATAAPLQTAGVVEEPADDCVIICISSLRAVFAAKCAASPFRIDANIVASSWSVETEAESASELGIVISSSSSSSSSSGDTSRELQVTWQGGQPLSAAEIPSIDGVLSTHHISVFSKEEDTKDYNSACGYLSFSISAEPAQPLAAPTSLADHVTSPAPSAADKKAQRRTEAVKAHARDLDTSLKSTKNENAALQQQNKVLQAQVQEQQQALLQQQQHIQALQAHMQQLTAQLTEASQRLAAFDMQQQQQQQAVQRMQQQRDAESRASAAEIARLQQHVMQLEDFRSRAEEEQRLHRKQIRNYRMEVEQHERELRRLREEQKDSDSKIMEQDKTIADLRILLTNARSRIRDERQRSEGLVGKLEAASEVETSLKAELQASQKAAEEGKRQLLSLTWGLEAPPVFTGFPNSAANCDKQPETESRQRQQQQKGGGRREADGETQHKRSHSDAHGVDVPVQSSSRTSAGPISSADAHLRRWDDARILRHLLPPTQPAGAVWGTALGLPMQEGYSHILLEQAGSSAQPWGGNIVATAAFVASICFNGAPCPDVNVALEKEVLEGGRVIVNVKLNQGARCVNVAGELEVSRPSRETPILLISALTPDSQKRSLRLRLPLPSAAFCVPFVLSTEAFATKWRSLEMQEDAVLLGMIPDRIRMAVSLCALGGRFHVLPFDEGEPRSKAISSVCVKVLLGMIPDRIRMAVSLCALGGRFHVLPFDEGEPRSKAPAASPGFMRIHASGGFPASADCTEALSTPQACLPPNARDSRSREKYIPCLIELSVKRNAFAGTERQIQWVSQWGRAPSGVLRVRCTNSPLRSSVLEVLLQQFLTSSQILNASSSSA